MSIPHSHEGAPLLFLVKREMGEGWNRALTVVATGREEAKDAARRALGGDPDWYVVTPLTGPHDEIVEPVPSPSVRAPDERCRDCGHTAYLHAQVGGFSCIAESCSCPKFRPEPSGAEPAGETDQRTYRRNDVPRLPLIEELQRTKSDLDRALRERDEAERERDEQATNLVEARDTYKRGRDEAREALKYIRDELSNGVTANWDYIDKRFDLVLRAAGSDKENRNG